MTLFYRSWRATVEDKEGNKKCFPRLVKMGKIIDTYELAIEIAEKSSLTPGDTLNVIDNLMLVMKRHLLNSRSVRLNGLGTFTIFCRARGNGVDTEEEVSSNQIKNLSVRFLPEYTVSGFEGKTRAMFQGVEFERIDRKEAEDEEHPIPDPDPGA